MVKVGNIIDFLLDYYPLNLASSFDEGKVGLQFGSKNKEVKKVMVALDGSTRVVQDAISQNVDLLVLHHPFMFSPMLSMNYDNPIQAKYKKVIQNELNVFAMHTNFDVGLDGMNDCLLRQLGVKTIKMLNDEPLKDSFLRYGEINLMTLRDLIELVKNKFKLEVVKYVGNLDEKIEVVGIVGGSGGYDLYTASRLGCNAFITGEIKHNLALDALDLGISLIEIPHATEGQFKKYILEKLQSKFTEVEFVTSRFDIDPFKIY